ncbi:hypothetical protein BLOT_010653 [Blomia tropicalis]|nr:hypothetical protein BLOT_010653 [Blomia tropicalis]
MDLSGDHLTRTKICVGSRKSQLAMVQTEWVINKLKLQHPWLQFEVITLDTIGDNILDRPLSQIGEKALFTRELEDQLLAGNVDLIVHSLKDMPTTLPDNCCIGSITEREDPTDSLVLRTGLSIPSNQQFERTISDVKVFGTSSLRRMAQLRFIKHEVEVKDMRGNLNTRLRKLDDYENNKIDCLVLATAGLIRNGQGDRISQRLPWYHAVSQGALGIECRLDDEFLLNRILPGLSNNKSMIECTAERVLMKCLEGGCSVPIGVRSKWLDSNTIQLEAIVLSLDGKRKVESDESRKITEPIDKQLVWSIEDYAYLAVDDDRLIPMKNAVILGRNLAAKMIELGVQQILSEINKQKKL